jgi:hypothetical protein
MIMKDLNSSKPRADVIPGLALLLAMGFPLAAAAQESDADQAAKLAKMLANPVASLISVPLQYDYNENFGTDDEGSKSVLNIQPVWPFSLGEKWNLVTRTIIPLADQNGVPPGTDASGTGDILQSFFFSPKEPVGGWILAAGPVLLYPTASDVTLGGEKWGAGPTVLALKQAGPWSVGMLANHVASFAGDEARADLSATLLQPFVAYITRTKTTFGLNTEATYDWENEQWSVPLNLVVSQLLKIGRLPVQFQVGVRYWADAPENGPDGLGYRAAVVFLFPK